MSNVRFVCSEVQYNAARRGVVSNRTVVGMGGKVAGYTILFSE